jgi:diphthine-ammonia ligase
MKVVASWSGGKDSAYASYLAKQQGHEIVCILTMMMSEEKSNFHMIRSDILDAQAEAMGIPLIKRKTSNETYERDFKAVLAELIKTKGAEGLVTGDIYEVAGHEEGWLNRVCREMGLKPVKPLWMGDTKQIYLDYLKAGFKATVVRTNSKLGIEWLGRELNRQFYDDIMKLGNIDPCGEGGEYHTVITDGPNFKKKIEILETQKHKLDGGFGYLEVKAFAVKLK